jgi:hypothetical protein
MRDVWEIDIAPPAAKASASHRLTHVIASVALTPYSTTRVNCSEWGYGSGRRNTVSAMQYTAVPALIPSAKGAGFQA